MHVAPVSTILQFYLASLQMFLKDIITTRSRKKGFMWYDILILINYIYTFQTVPNKHEASQFLFLQLSLQKFILTEILPEGLMLFSSLPGKQWATYEMAWNTLLFHFLSMLGSEHILEYASRRCRGRNHPVGQ